MLREIHIKNLGIIESIQIKFHEGFHVISGETGAGKSILLQAIAFALGNRADSEAIRAGQKEAAVTLVVEPQDGDSESSRFQELGIAPAEDGVFFLRRTLNAAGKSRAYLNDEPVTLKTLQRLGQAWIHLVAQHAAQELLEEDFIIAALDRFGALDGLKAEYRKFFELFRERRNSFRELEERVAKARAQEDFLRYQCEELEKAGMTDGEEEDLEARKQRLKHRVTLASQSFEIRQALLESDDSISDRLGKVLSIADKLRTLDPGLLAFSNRLREVVEAVNLAAREIGDYDSGLQEDPEDLNKIEDRLALLGELKRKYRAEIPELLQKLVDLKRQVDQLDHGADRLGEAAEALQRATSELQNKAASLGGERRKQAKRLALQLGKTLKGLALPHAKVSFAFQPISLPEEFRSDGADRLSLQVSFNPGEEMRAVEEVISGGELSRLLLSFCEILYPADRLGTLIFDEVDAGVGGGVAELIGKKLEGLSRRAQVFCVTHLPQIACHASWHYIVEKEVRAGRTFSKIRLLNQEERIGEIARMLAGVKVTEQALKHAKELLKNAAA